MDPRRGWQEAVNPLSSVDLQARAHARPADMESAAQAPSWTCSACGVTTRYLPGHGPEGDLPPGFTEADDGTFRCLPCQRQAVRDALGEDASTEALADSLIAFEHGRQLADDTPRTIRSRLLALGLPPRVVSLTRIRELAQAEPLGSAAPESNGRGTRAEQAARREAIVAELRRDPRRSNAEVAAVLGCPESTVGRTRRRLEAAGKIERHRASKWDRNGAAA